MTTKATKTPKLPNLEASLAEITQLVDNMEHGEQTLEQSLSNFERGITLIKHCQHILTEADHKVQLLIQKNGQETLGSYGVADEGTDTDDSANE